MQKTVIRKFKNRFIFTTVYLLIFLIRSTPRSIAIFLSKNVAVLVYYFAPKERKKTVKNLKKIFGNKWSEKEIHDTSKKVFINLGRNIVDIIKLKKNTDAFFSTQIKCTGWENFEKAHSKKKGVICLACHMGAFELLPHYMAWKGYPICVTGTKIYDPKLNKLIIENRLGDNITYVERGKDSGREIIRHLVNGNLFGVLIDQDTKVDGVFAPFLGKEAFTPSAPIKLAMRTKSAIVPLVIKTDKNNFHHITIEKEIELVNTGNTKEDVIENTTRCNNVISKWIEETPEQWVWMHNRWKTKNKKQNL